MRLKGAIQDEAVRLLDRELLPLLEKFGKTCVVLFRPGDVHFIQKPVDADGMQVTARCSKELFFEEGSYLLQARHKDCVAFSFDLSLLRRVLSAATRNDVDTVEMKLTLRSVPSGGDAPNQSRPFLSFSTADHRSSVSIVQDLPITKPFAPSQVDRLVRDLESESCPAYLDLQPEMANLQALVDRLKPLGSSLTLATTRSGNMHIQVVTPQLHLGAEFRDLMVLPAAARSDAPEYTGQAAEDRLRDELQAGTATAVTVQLKHLQKCLVSTGPTQRQQLWCGISPQSDFVHMLFVFTPPQSGPIVDDPGALELSYKMPVFEN